MSLLLIIPSYTPMPYVVLLTLLSRRHRRRLRLLPNPKAIREAIRNFLAPCDEEPEDPPAMDSASFAEVLRSALSHIPEERMAAEDLLNKVNYLPFR
ncbi:hypothetical protein BHE74_00030601 [Ensete ventricosum]|nr:hypothetical protein GW17_00045026 [Ensete ventricosum]RWW62288.1 hypothetical protein BHE74_00030601 [Ensete ventricosum]RZS11778.1 hypothetical protein BHM03_00043144 [Ensete ventricosum]